MSSHKQTGDHPAERGDREVDELNELASPLGLHVRRLTSPPRRFAIGPEGSHPNYFGFGYAIADTYDQAVSHLISRANSGRWFLHLVHPSVEATLLPDTTPRTVQIRDLDTGQTLNLRDGIDADIHAGSEATGPVVTVRVPPQPPLDDAGRPLPRPKLSKPPSVGRWHQ